MTALTFLIAALATWRVTSLVLKEKGPFNVLVHLRTAIGSIKGLAALTECHWCLSIWVAVPITLIAFTPAWVVLIPFALSALSIGVDRYVG